MDSNGIGLSSDVRSRRLIELTVHDKLHNEARVFRCERHLLEKSMAYFKPAIRLYEKEEEALEEEAKNIRGFIDIKEGVALANTTANASVATTATNSIGSDGVGCVVNSTNVINGEKGIEEGAVGYLKSGHCGSLPPIPLRVNCDMQIFSWLMAHIEGKRRPLTPDIAVSIALSSNFLLMPELVYMSLQYIKENLLQVMLSGVSMECLTGELLARLSAMLSESEIAAAFLKLLEFEEDEHASNRRFLTALLRHMVCDRLGQQRASGLSWCRYCGVLFDQHELRRLCQSEKNVKPLICPRLTANSIGARGELLTTHVASEYSVDLVFPSLSWSDQDVERWAWRVIGAAYIFLCQNCRRLVSLIDTVTHKCHEGTPAFVSLDKSSLADADALVTCYGALNSHYESGLLPIYSHKNDIPRETVLTLLASGEWSCEDGSESEVPGLWSSHPMAVGKSVDARGEVNLDVQNGFERWFQLELQEMMEEFSEPDHLGGTQLGDVHQPSAFSHSSPLPSSSSLQQQQEQPLSSLRSLLSSQQFSRVVSSCGPVSTLGGVPASTHTSHRLTKRTENRAGGVSFDDQALKLRNSRNLKASRVALTGECKGAFRESKKLAVVGGNGLSFNKSINAKPIHTSNLSRRSEVLRGSLLTKGRAANLHGKH